MAANEKNKIKKIFTDLVDSPPSTEKDKSILKRNESICNPQSKDLFLQRVKTFTTTNWAAKPFELSPLHCAQYGWCNEHQDQLRCVTCNATIYAGIPDDWDSSAYAEICTKLQNELQIGHEKLCPWPNNPCPPSFLSLPSYTADQWKKVIKDAFDDLVLLKNDLPELNEDEVASMSMLDNSCIEELLISMFHFHHGCDDEALQGKVACILALSGWCASKPIVEDPSITCAMCGMEAGLWNYKSIGSRMQKRIKTQITGAISQQSLPDVHDVMSSSVSVKSEKSENSTHSGSMSHELSKLATSSDSLAQSDLLKPAGSQESLINLRMSDSRLMAVDSTDHHEIEESSQSNRHDKLLFSEPRLPHATPPELMKELLLSTAPGSHRSHSIYSDSIFSEVGSECFEKRLEETNEKDLELDKAVSENPPNSHPTHVQQQWMKELLFMTAETKHTDITESVVSDIGSVSFDKRLDNSSVINSPRAMTPITRTNSIIEEEDAGAIRNKRMRFHEPYTSYFSMIDEHRHWCPWINFNAPDDEGNTSAAQCSTKSPGTLQGWKIVLFKLLPVSGTSVSTSASSPPAAAEAWKTVRTVLGDCVSSPRKSVT